LANVIVATVAEVLGELPVAIEICPDWSEPVTLTVGLVPAPVPAAMLGAVAPAPFFSRPFASIADSTAPAGDWNCRRSPVCEVDAPVVPWAPSAMPHLFDRY
jgi:hypothetical protein